ncbi:hypothetical protein FH115_07210 [Staphylococcus hominis]|uniref:hypothetical protein n=1 Tax=Staphylococcus hominis TaxID=1290 RepID=UPI001F58AFA2|nr:hypothetical protein [Staphylococcus hominis]MCI2869473.1 hypothetical protein [Staphylococcus hominis]MDS3893820.1 hypothetical protein [Staphylococcus hominis]
MAEVKLSMEEYHNVVKSLYTLIEKLYEMTKKCIDYKKQRDELINDMQNVKRKAEAYDKIKEAADSEKLNGYSLYDNERFIDRLCQVFDEMEADH